MITALFRHLAGVFALAFLVSPAHATDVQPAVRLQGSMMGHLEVKVDLAHPVPYRIFAVDAPQRVIIDIQSAEIPDVQTAAFPRSVKGIRTGRLDADWTRVIIDLSIPQRLLQANLADGVLQLTFRRTSAAAFADWAAARPDPTGLARPTIALPAHAKSRPRIVIDAGHGGIDPGAVREGVYEKDIALAFALQLRDAVAAHGVADVLMTRDADIFLPLKARTDFARAAQADVFLSVHANTVTEGDATGAALYTLSRTASDAEAAALALKENRADLVAGLDLSGQGDTLTRAVLELRQGETAVKSRALANHVMQALAGSVGVLEKNPVRQADFRVLKAPEVPSVLLELGFLSNKMDRAHMQDPAWRTGAATALAQALVAWMQPQEAQADNNSSVTQITRP